MHLEYNGVSMELLQLDQVSREAVYSSDGQDLLYVKWIIGATCVYAPGGYPVGTAVINPNPDTKDELYPSANLRNNNRDVRGRNPQVWPFEQAVNTLGGQNRLQPSHTAVVTDVELKSRLWTPRQKLRLWVWDGGLGEGDATRGNRQVWMESPRGDFPTDMAGGPKPLAVDVVTAAGEGLNFGVHFQIMTHLSPCPEGSDRLILSHRWQMSHHPDEDQYLSRIIEGEVVFNQAVLLQADYNPDWLRSQFLHPIPLGFKRKNVDVVQSSDGSTIRYTIVDTDSTIMFDAGDSGATEIEIIENVSYANPFRY